ncbi:MAG: hypothetical protein ABSA63_07885 [Thermoplasmata archaeon]|jgi:hypothetical protein
MSSAIPSATMRPPTSNTVSGGTTSREARVNRPSTIETRTTAPSSRTTQSVATSSVEAARTRAPVRVSILRIRKFSSEPGMPEPTWTWECAGSSMRERSESFPVETIRDTSTRPGGRDSNPCVH